MWGPPPLTAACFPFPPRARSKAAVAVHVQRWSEPSLGGPVICRCIAPFQGLSMHLPPRLPPASAALDPPVPTEKCECAPDPLLPNPICILCLCDTEKAANVTLDEVGLQQYCTSAQCRLAMIRGAFVPLAAMDTCCPEARMAAKRWNNAEGLLPSSSNSELPPVPCSVL